GARNQTVQLWNVEQSVQQQKCIGAILVPKGEDERVLSVAFSPDGLFLAGGGKLSTNHLLLWNVSDVPWNELLRVDVYHPAQLAWLQLKPLIGHGAFIRSVVFSRDGTMLASGSDDHTVRLWKCAKCTPVPTPTLAGP